MILNERQYRLTQARVADADQALERAREEAASLPADLAAIHLAALEGNLDQMRADLAAYEAIRDGREPIEAEGLAQLPLTLIRGRIRKHLSQRELAQRLGVKEQQIQRWEANLYHGVAIDRLDEIARAVEVRVIEAIG